MSGSCCWNLMLSMSQMLPAALKAFADGCMDTVF